jgi:hypothetical protein
MIVFSIKGTRPDGALAYWDGWYDDRYYDGCDRAEEMVADLQRAKPGIEFTIVTHECEDLEDLIEAWAAKSTKQPTKVG